MKYMMKLGFVLFMFCAIGSGILAYVNMVTKDKIAANKSLDENNARKELFSTAKDFERMVYHSGQPDSLVYFIAKDTNGQVLGYSTVCAGKGYSSTVKTMIAVDSTLTVQTLKVIEQNETPGLGTNAQKPDFPDRFKGKGISEMDVDKDGGKITSITGATITTRAIAKSVKAGLIELKKALQERQQSLGGKK